MSIRRIIDPNQSKFDPDKAKELIALGREARLLFIEYERVKNEDNSDDLFQQGLPVGSSMASPLNKRSYKIVAPLVFTQIVLKFFGQRRVFGFIAESTDPQSAKEEIFIVYRGSQTPSDWVSNFRIFQTKRPLRFSSENYCSYVPGEVHKGFNDQYTRPDNRRQKPSIATIVEQTLTKEFIADRKIYIAGHSLGAALATLTAAHVKLLHKQADVYLYTSASPRVGDADFEEYFLTENIKSFRIYNQLDWVPKLPPRFESPGEAAQYVHVGEPIPFTSQTGNFQFNHTLPVYACALGLEAEEFNYQENNKPLPFTCPRG